MTNKTYNCDYQTIAENLKKSSAKLVNIVNKIQALANETDILSKELEIALCEVALLLKKDKLQKQKDADNIVNISTLGGNSIQMKLCEMPFKEFVEEIIKKFNFENSNAKDYAIIINGVEYVVSDTMYLSQNMIEMAVNARKKIHIIKNEV